eukprot:2340625-Rhodomonas_salina.5
MRSPPGFCGGSSTIWSHPLASLRDVVKQSMSCAVSWVRLIPLEEERAKAKRKEERVEHRGEP